ncbi:MAG: YkgJ family cysteine cluster protein, partial [Desulfobacterales bacterium]|nr:YkgJ family cysteine cluster protein [Desulfobacterales bacterium]
MAFGIIQYGAPPFMHLLGFIQFKYMDSFICYIAIFTSIYLLTIYQDMHKYEPYMDEKYKSLLIKELEQELADASNISTGSIASKIEDIGFSCLMCGKCCRREFGDNRVLLIPQEIQIISDHTGMDPDEIRTPAISDDPELTDLSDEKRRIHTFGWMLLRKKNEDCNFIEDSDVSNKCKIHDVRTMLCRTYPFYMQEMELHVSKCEGLGSTITPKESLKVASDVIDRYVAEIEDT